MNSSAANSRIASRRSQSITWRCTSGSDTRRRSGRGGKRPAGTTTPALLLPLLPLLSDQEAVGQHHTDRMPMESGPQPPLVLVPAQQTLRLLVVPLHPVPPVRVLHHRRQRLLRPEVTPVILGLPVLTTPRPFPDQPALPAPATRRHPPAAHRRESAPQPALAPLAPAHGPPGRARQPGQQRIGPLRRRRALRRHGEVGTDGHHVPPPPPLLQAGQEVGVVAVVGVGDDAVTADAPGAGLVQQR